MARGKDVPDSVSSRAEAGVGGEQPSLAGSVMRRGVGRDKAGKVSRSGLRECALPQQEFQ